MASRVVALISFTSSYPYISRLASKRNTSSSGTPLMKGGLVCATSVRLDALNDRMLVRLRAAAQRRTRNFAPRRKGSVSEERSTTETDLDRLPRRRDHPNATFDHRRQAPNGRNR